MNTDYLKEFGPFVYDTSRETISVLNEPTTSRVVSYKTLKSNYSDKEIVEYLDAMGSYISSLSKTIGYTLAIASADYSIFSIRIDINRFFKLEIYNVSPEFINEIANSKYFNFNYLKQLHKIGMNILYLYSNLSDEVKLRIELN